MISGEVFALLLAAPFAAMFAFFVLVLALRVLGGITTWIDEKLYARYSNRYFSGIRGQSR